MSAKLIALQNLLISKGVITGEELGDSLSQVQSKARDDLESDYPGIVGWVESLFGDPDFDNVIPDDPQMPE